MEVAGAGFAVARSATFEHAQRARLPATFRILTRIPRRVAVGGRVAGAGFAVERSETLSTH